MRQGWRTALLGLALLGTIFSGQTAAFAQEGSPAASPAASPAGACAEPTRADLEKIVHIWYEKMFAAQDATMLEPYLAPNTVYHAGAFPDASGPAAVERVFTNVFAGFPDIKTSADVVAIDAPYVAVVWTASGTNTGELQGAPATGRSVTWRGIGIHRFECGKIVESWTELDQLGQLQQLGRMPAPQSTPAAATPAAPMAASPAACAATTPEQAATVVRRSWDDVWTGGDLDALNDLVTDDVVHHWAIGPDTIGRQGMSDRIATLRTVFPDLTITYGPLVQDGAYVAATWTIRGTHQGAYLGIPPTGNPIDATGINVFRIECGKIAEVWSEMDAVTLLQQMGALPAATPTAG